MAEKMTPERASEILGQGFHCSQCVMGHAAEVMGLDVDEARKRTAALGGGMFWGEMCGAVLGAGVALGEAYGFDQANPGEKDTIMQEKVREFQRRFTEKYGTVQCKMLLGGFDLSKPEGANPCDREDPFVHCGEYCASACEILDDMLPHAEE